jgi:hypothetical protein
MTRPVHILALAAALALPEISAAQPLGTFRWQLQPFCNVVTVNVTQQGAVYTLDGYDNQCGTGQRAPLVGLATRNPDGSIGLGLHVVTVPGARGLQIDARIDPHSKSGSWTDSAGNSGTFALGANMGGAPRPAPTVSIAPGSITAVHLAPGAVGAAQIDPGQVQARVNGVCASGQTVRSINPDGTVVCVDALTTVDDPVPSVGQYTSMAIGADGLPIVSHQDLSARALRVTRCANAACTRIDGSVTADDPAGAAGAFTSIAIGADGLPVISHRDNTVGALRVTHCGNPGCTSGNVSTTVDADPANAVGFYTSIAIGADGLPVISHGVQDGTLRVTHCGNAACTSGNVSTTVDGPANNVGAYTSIAIGADGLPIVSHRNQTASALRVTHCGNAACTSGNVSTTVDPANLGGAHTSLAIGVDGLPVISHRDDSAGALRVTHCGNAACTSGNVSTTVDDPADSVGFFTSIAIGADGLPVISHENRTIGGLRVTHCGNTACTSGNASITVDDPRAIEVGAHTSIAIGTDGLPIISHYDASALALRVAKCGTRTCQ